MVCDFICERDFSFEDLKARLQTTVRTMEPFKGRNGIRDGNIKYSSNYIRSLLKVFLGYYLGRIYNYF